MEKKSIKIGVVGNALSGKDIASDYLSKKHGFIHISTGEMIREHIAENNLGEPVRELMQSVGNSIRDDKGPEYFIRKALQMSEGTDRVIVSGIRAIGEAEYFQENEGIIIAVDASIEKRYERAMYRQRHSDFVTFEEFIQHEKFENKFTHNSKQNVKEVMNRADYLVINEGTLEEFYSKIDELIYHILDK